MKQLEIEMFFPLTQQLELDLDYGPTHIYYRAKGIAGIHSMPIKGSTYEFTKVATASCVTWTEGHLNIDVESTTIKTKNKPPLYRRWLYQLLGLKWEVNGK